MLLIKRFTWLLVLLIVIAGCAKGTKEGGEGIIIDTTETLYSEDDKVSDEFYLYEAEEAPMVKRVLQKELSTGSVNALQPVTAEPAVEMNSEDYNKIDENPFLETIDNPLSTFSIDVDTASYANVRRYLNGGSMPPVDAVRIEELINYFTYDYSEPTGDAPFSFTTELSECPWNEEHELLLIGLQAEKIDMQDLPPNNLVFLIDTSSSMSYDNKLPLLKKAFRLLIQELRPVDTVSIVAYADATGLVLKPTKGDQKDAIMKALDSLDAGGSTAGGAGIELAYATALKNFDEDANNRVILATDGDFNVGVSSEAELERLIEEKREDGIYLTVLGFGTGNYQDAKMESLADTGNGNFAYIDNIMEAKKVLVNEFGGTLVTIAKDVKMQIEFNPTIVESYRLIGYENRMLAAEDFDDDTKDAGELGSGHSVTALYEIVLADYATENASELRYTTTTVSVDETESNELMYIKFRYKKPDEDESILLDEPVAFNPVVWEDVSDNMKFASSVAAFGMLLRDSENKGDATYSSVKKWAEASMGQDPMGYRSEFIDLVEIAKKLDKD